MKILYVSNLCSEDEYNKIFNESKILVSQQSQKFNRLIAEGFALNECDVQVVSGRPVSNIQRQKIFKEKDEFVNGVKYHYLGFVNYKIIRNIILSLRMKKYAKRWCKTNPDGIMFCDALNLSVASAASKIFHKKNMPIITCITDLPEDLMIGNNKLKSKIFTKYFQGVSRRSTHYVLLSKYMKESLSVFDKPSIIIEGVADKTLIKNNKIEKKNSKKIIMYAGLLYRKYGVCNLLNGFIKANLKDYELHFYGIGNNNDAEDDALKYILEAEKLYNNIKYCGSVNSKECFRKEQQATLLVNPRPTNERFVRNSFPSKNIEYMSSGTPLLTTKIPSMPEEYKDFCFILEDESENGVCDKLIEICSMDNKRLNEIGFKAREFILRNKNNQAQTRKIIEFVKK